MLRSTASFLMCCIAVRHLSGTEDLMLDLKTMNPAAHAPSSNCGVELSQGLSKGKDLGRNSWLLEDGTADVMHLATWRPCSARLNACVSLVLHFTSLHCNLLSSAVDDTLEHVTRYPTCPSHGLPSISVQYWAIACGQCCAFGGSFV